MSNKRKRIGVLIGSAIAPYMRKIINGIYQGATDLGIDLVVFAGSQLEYNFVDGGAVDKDYDYLNALTREHVKRNKLDGMIIVYGSHCVFMGEDVRKRLLESYANLPYILMEEFSDKENTGYIINDNYNSMRLVVEHLVTYHGYSKFLYVGGRYDNREAIERQRAFEDVLIENGITVTPEMMVDGAFNEDCEPQVEELLDRNEKPEVIVCASDLMAYAVYKVLKRRGMTIGNPRLSDKAIAVTGYDDDVRAVSSDPPLTTVAQDFFYSGYNAVENILTLLRDGIIDGSIAPNHLKKRASCGCNYGKHHRYLPMNETERAQPEFYAIKIAELMREEILTSNVRDEIGDKIYDILYESIYKDALILNGFVKETINSEIVVDQLRRLIDSPYSRYISPYSMLREFSDYMSSLIHSSNDPSNMVLMSDIMVEGMKYIQNHIIYQSNQDSFRYETGAMQLSLLARNMSLRSSNLGDMFTAAFEKIDYADKSDIFIFLYDEPLNRHEGEKTFDNAVLRLAASKTGKGGIRIYERDDRPRVSDEKTALHYASEYEDDKSDRYCFVDMHHEDKIYGLVVSRMDEDDIMYLTLLSFQIAMMLAMRNGNE